MALYVCMCSCVYACVPVWACICVRVYMHARVSVHICMCVCLHVCACGCVDLGLLYGVLLTTEQTASPMASTCPRVSCGVLHSCIAWCICRNQGYNAKFNLRLQSVTCTYVGDGCLYTHDSCLSVTFTHVWFSSIP